MTSIQPGTIVVAVDGSADSDRAVLWAAEEAYLQRRPLTVVTAAPDGDRATNDTSVELARHWRPGLDVEGVVLPGRAQDLLVELSTLAHLVVIGSRGRGPIGSTLLGSVSTSVSREAACPVVVSRPGPAGRVRHGILVHADGTPASAPAIEFAFNEASLRDLPVTVMSTASGEEPPSERVIAESVAGFKEVYPDVYVSRHLGQDFAKECRSTESARWDLIVVGRRAETGDRHAPGPSAMDVLEHAQTLVAVVPELSSDRLDGAWAAGTTAAHRHDLVR